VCGQISIALFTGLGKWGIIYQCDNFGEFVFEGYRYTSYLIKIFLYLEQNEWVNLIS